MAVSPQMRLVEDNTSSLSLLDIYKNTCAKKGLDHDNPIARYYEKLGSVQARGAQAGHPVLRDILREVQTTMVPKTLLKDWAASTFASATDFWTFRKVFTLQVLEALERRFHIVWSFIRDKVRHECRIDIYLAVKKIPKKLKNSPKTSNG